MTCARRWKRPASWVPWRRNDPGTPPAGIAGPNAGQWLLSQTRRLKITDEKLNTLLKAFAYFYWSVPVAFVADKIAEWYPEVTAEQLERVLNRRSESNFLHPYYVVTDGVDQPELAIEHLIAIDEDDYDRFIATRIDAPFYDCDEETLLHYTKDPPDIPEVNAIIDFGKQELGLDDEWALQLINDCALSQPYSLCDGTSWVESVLAQERFGKIRFRTIDQLKRFRQLGNSLYQVLPNPVFRGWKPAEIDNAPALMDDIPERDEDIPDARPQMEDFFAKLGGRENALRILTERMSETASERPQKKRKIGRNEPCPCGSGKKYKKCCGR